MPLRHIFIFLITSIDLLLTTGCGPRETRVSTGDRTQTIHIGNGSEPSDLDPQLITTITDAQIVMGLMEGLTTMDPHTAHPTPAVAKSWESSADQRTWTFHLRNDARWSNGDAVTARDFVYAYQRILSPNLASEYAYMLFCLTGAENYNNGQLKDFNQVGVQAIDDHTLVLSLQNPVPYLPALVMHQAWFPVHKATIEKFGKMDQRGTLWTRPINYVGNGAFTLTAWEPHQVIRLAKSPAYWDQASVRAHEIDFYPIEDRATEEAAFRSGQLHITAGLPVDKIATYQRDQPKLLRQESTFATTYILFNCTKPPLNDARIRRALTLVIDRKALTERVLKGGRIPAYNLTPPGIAGYDAGTYLKEDVNEARRLLADAGFPNGTGFPRLELMASKGSNSLFSEAIQQMWLTQLGLNIAIVNQEGRVFSDSVHSHQYDLAAYGWVGDYLDPSTFLELMTRESGNNNTGWSSPAYDRLITEARATGNDSHRYALYREAEHILIDEMPLAPLCFMRRNYLCQPSVKGWYGNPLDLHPLKSVYLEP